ncbi:MAG TPA: hypothetical protein DIW47_08095 [Bacteroidetes bacterium]|nr:hypothetical protein [Bacteroidota bacterium]
MRIRIALFFFWVAVSFGCVGLQAQTDTTRKKIIVQEPGRTLLKNEETKGLLVKTSIFRWMRGEIPLLFEVPIGKNTRLEFGPTLTFFDYGFQLLAEGYLLENSGKFGDHDAFIMGPENFRIGMGFTAHIKYLFYQEDLFSGSGIGLYTNIRRHKYDFTYYQATFEPGLVRARELALLFVNQNHDWGFREFNIGPGIIQHKMDYAKYDDSKGTVYASPETASFITPAIFWNLKFGLAVFTR